MQCTNGIIFVRLPTLPPNPMNPPRFQMTFSRNPEKLGLLLSCSPNKTPRDLTPRHCTNLSLSKCSETKSKRIFFFYKFYQISLSTWTNNNINKSELLYHGLPDISRRIEITAPKSDLLV